MKSISLYVDKDTYLTRMHPFTKLCYILTAVAASLIAGKLWAFAIFIGISLVMLISGKIMKKVFPLIAFSFTILITIFLIHGLFNHENANLMFQLGPLKFYREGMMYALRISCNVLNMLLAFAVFFREQAFFAMLLPVTQPMYFWHGGVPAPEACRPYFLYAPGQSSVAVSIILLAFYSLALYLWARFYINRHDLIEIVTEG